MNARILYWAITSALAGFLFGFDTVVISGAEKTIQQIWGLSAGMHGLAMGSALYGTVIGALIGGWPTDKFGRKPTLIFVGFLFIIGALGSALADSVGLFIAARFIGGVGIGISTIAAPLYISEIAPAAFRGRLTGMFQFNIVFGIIIAYVSNALIEGLGISSDWRWMLGVGAVPSIIYAAMCLGLPESPRWLIGRKRDLVGGAAVLRLIEPKMSDHEIKAYAEEIQSASIVEAKVSSRFWSWRLRVPILLAFMIAFFNQLSGINAVLYFAPRIFELTGLGPKAALLQSIGIGIANLVFTFIGLSLIDRIGRRTLLYIGSFGYILSLGLTSWAFFTHHYSIVPACIFAFIGAHAMSQGAVIWVFISEIFPSPQRAQGQTLGAFTHWMFAALLTSFFPTMVTALAPGLIFSFFCFMMVLQLIWVRLFVPETKGIPLEEMQQRLGITSEAEPSLA